MINTTNLIIVLICLIACLGGCLIMQFLKIARLEDRLYDAKAALSMRIAEGDKRLSELDVKLNHEMKTVIHSNTELKERIEELEEEMSGIRKDVDDIPVDEIVQRNKDEQQYFESLHSIFDYGGNIPKLNLDGLNK